MTRPSQDVAQASPTKQFFVSMLTRDIGLDDELPQPHRRLLMQHLTRNRDHLSHRVDPNVYAEPGSAGEPHYSLTRLTNAFCMQNWTH